MAIVRVWIEEGCIACNWCGDLSPEIFQVTGGSCRIRADIRADRLSNANRTERALLVAPVDGQMGEFLQFVADGCPAQVIKLQET